MAFTVKQLAVGGFDNNFSYFITADNGDAALVDPTGEAEIIRRALAEYGTCTPRYILLTHGHLDHSQALGEILADFPAQIIAHPNHPEAGGKRVRDGEKIPFGDGFIELLFTPGHSRDSVCYRLSDDTALFTGDVLFVGCVGFCRSREMFNSLNKKILPLADTLVIYSGHDYGTVPFRTLGEEKQLNPFLNCADLDGFRQKLREMD
jgi:glyoxylase-like metal-dependent hydrolase (beta-lactamase superfamily II)